MDKTAVIGMKNRDIGKVAAEVVNRDADTLQGFVEDYTEPTATVYTDGTRLQGHGSQAPRRQAQRIRVR